MDNTSSDSREASADVDPMAAGGFGIRFLGRLIDTVVATASGCVAGVFGGIFLAVLAQLGKVSPGWQTRVNASLLTNLAWGLLATVACHTLAEGIAGTSIGKLVLGYRVVSLRDFAPCEPKAAFVRTLGYFVDALFFGIPAYTSMNSSPWAQRYGDKWAGTAVIKAGALPARAKRSNGLVAAGLIAGFIAHGVVSAAGLVLHAM